MTRPDLGTSVRNGATDPNNNLSKLNDSFVISPDGFNNMIRSTVNGGSFMRIPSHTTRPDLNTSLSEVPFDHNRVNVI